MAVGGSLNIELGWPASTRVDRLGRCHPGAYPDELVAELVAAYRAAGPEGVLDLSSIAAKWGKNKGNLCRAAKALGLPVNQRRRMVDTRKDRRKFKGDAEALKAAQSTHAKDMIATNGHPRGMLGKKHTEEVRRAIAEKSKSFWANMSEEERQKQRDKMYHGRVDTAPPKIARGSWKAGWREIGGKRTYFRSRWEANYARWLQLLKEQGDIVDWEFEPVTFWFDKIKRGVRSYKPDFRVTGGTSPEAITWHEVKGWMDARSHTTLKRMAKYHPDEIIILVREPSMKKLGKAFAGVLEGWE